MGLATATLGFIAVRSGGFSGFVGVLVVGFVAFVLIMRAEEKADRLERKAESNGGGSDQR
jgi:hypothetical protein